MVYNFAEVCQQCTWFVRVCSIINRAFGHYKQGTKIKGLVLNRVCILGIFWGSGLQTLSDLPTPKYWSSTPPPGVYSHPYPRKNRPRQPSYLVYLKFDRISVSNTLLTPSPLTQLSYSKYKLQYTDARVSGSIRSPRYPQVNYASLFAIAP